MDGAGNLVVSIIDYFVSMGGRITDMFWVGRKVVSLKQCPHSVFLFIEDVASRSECVSIP